MVKRAYFEHLIETSRNSDISVISKLIKDVYKNHNQETTVPYEETPNNRVPFS